MSEEKRTRRGWRWITLYSIYGVAAAAQLCLLSIGRVAWLVPAGWVLFALSAVLGWVPVLAFRRHGRVAEG